MFNIGTPELILVLVVALIVLGPRRLPELARSIGRGLREFQKAADDVKDSLTRDLREEPEVPLEVLSEARADSDNEAGADKIGEDKNDLLAPGGIEAAPPVEPPAEPAAEPAPAPAEEQAAGAEAPPRE